MSRVPVGKVLLRNVIRHTGAHNKLQEETEMWKIREWEKQTEETYWKRQSRMLSDTSSSRMRSDGFDEEGHRADWKPRNPQLLDLVEDDLLRARSWNKKLYECEANMPDRWGHSGYKELYPEEFDTDSDQQEGDEQNAVNGKKRSHLGKQTARESHKRKKTKKSHKKKQKKRSHKKRKKKKKEQERSSTDSSRGESEGSAEETPSARKGKHKRKKKPRKVPAKEPTSSSGQESDFCHASSSSTSSSEDTESEGKKEKRPPRKRKKRHSSVPERPSEVPEKRSKRKNWKLCWARPCSAAPPRSVPPPPAALRPATATARPARDTAVPRLHLCTGQGSELSVCCCWGCSPQPTCALDQLWTIPWLQPSPCMATGVWAR